MQQPFEVGAIVASVGQQRAERGQVTTLSSVRAERRGEFILGTLGAQEGTTALFWVVPPPE